MDNPKSSPLLVKCLLVDDRDENLLALTAVLRRDDVEILQARSGAEALELLLDHPDVALAILDVQMPEMDGFELAELMRGSARTQDIPIIFVTAGSHDQQRVFKGYDSGAFDFLYKPVAGHVLRSKAELFFELFRQRRQLEDQLLELKEILRLNEMFCAVLGHDLRGPLHVISMASNLVRSLHGDPTTERALLRVDSNVSRMDRMIADLLDLARARLAGGIPLKREMIDAGPLLERLVSEYGASQPAGRVSFKARGNLVGRWDGDRFAQMLGNLLGNALEHGTAQSPVHVALDGADAERLILSVKNHGAVPVELRSQLFNPFRLGSGDTNKGLGLGLYIVQRIAEAHDGQVEVFVCDAEQTTEFRVIVPRLGQDVLRL